MQINYKKAVELSRKYFFALSRTAEAPNTPKGIHELGGFEARVLTAIGVQRINQDPEELIKDARKSAAAFDALRFAAAQHTAHNFALPASIRLWVSSYLAGKLERPIGKDGKPSSEGMRREIYGAVVRLTEMGMKPTRNDASPPHSACDAIAEALRDLGLSPTTYRAVKAIYSDGKRGKSGGKYPSQFVLRDGRVLDTD